MKLRPQKWRISILHSDACFLLSFSNCPKVSPLKVLPWLRLSECPPERIFVDPPRKTGMWYCPFPTPPQHTFILSPWNDNGRCTSWKCGPVSLVLLLELVAKWKWVPGGYTLFPITASSYKVNARGHNFPHLWEVLWGQDMHDYFGNNLCPNGASLYFHPKEEIPGGWVNQDPLPAFHLPTTDPAKGEPPFTFQDLCSLITSLED